MDIIRHNIAHLQTYLVELMKANITTEMLLYSKIGKNLKYFSDFCKVYSCDFPELEKMGKSAASILLKWKNYVNNTLLDENIDNGLNFVKSRSSKKIIKLVKKTKTTTKTTTITTIREGGCSKTA